MTKDELGVEIVAMAAELGIEPVQLAETHDGLMKQATELRQAIAAKGQLVEATVDAAKEAAEAKEAVVAKKATPPPPVSSAFVVAPGGSITSKRGLLVAGSPVSAALLGGGEAAFQTLIKAGRIVKN